MAVEKKEAVKAVETKAAAKAEVKAEPVKAAAEVKAAPAEKKAAAPKAVKAPAEKKAAAPKAAKAPAEKKAPAAKKAPAKKAEPKATVIVEYAGKQVVAKDVLAAATKAFKAARKGVEIKTIDIYVKPEENVAYYVVNGEGSDDYKVEL